MNRRVLKGYVLIFLVLVLYTAVIVPFPKSGRGGDFIGCHRRILCRRSRL